MNTRFTGDEWRKARRTLPTVFQKNYLKIIVILLSDLRYPCLSLTKTEAWQDFQRGLWCKIVFNIHGS